LYVCSTTTSHDFTYKNLSFVIKARMGAVVVRATVFNCGSIYQPGVDVLAGMDTIN